jgi:hypothetical protein
MQYYEKQVTLRGVHIQMMEAQYEVKNISMVEALPTEE